MYVGIGLSDVECSLPTWGGTLKNPPPLDPATPAVSRICFRVSCAQFRQKSIHCCFSFAQYLRYFHLTLPAVMLRSVIAPLRASSRAICARAGGSSATSAGSRALHASSTRTYLP